jgi:endonuclease III
MDREMAVRQLKALKRNIFNSEIQLAAEWNKEWQILISTILSAQTRDETTIKISNILYKKYPTLKKLAKARLSDVKKIIRPINFYKTKAKNIIETARIIVDEYRGKMPESIEKLLELPGVGRKVANVYLAEAYGAPAIGIDTHCRRLSRKLGWTKESNPHKIEKDLERLFPKRYWNSINYILVRFGRTYGQKGEDEILKKIKTLS